MLLIKQFLLLKNEFFLFYVLAYNYLNNLNEIQVFNLDLTLIRRFSTSPHQPLSITFSSNQLYVGTIEEMILIYQNETIIKKRLNGTLLRL